MRIILLLTINIAFCLIATEALAVEEPDVVRLMKEDSAAPKGRGLKMLGEKTKLSADANQMISIYNKAKDIDDFCKAIKNEFPQIRTYIHNVLEKESRYKSLIIKLSDQYSFIVHYDEKEKQLLNYFINAEW